ncbi:8-oxo-dGTP diphosphatase MutT [Marinicellulosiphila megalodicopiae]|uniref:8-oxo-dGTP diphosphatase MutT n=1 Tax=Marinicellulosiphila megalodicopiae TaxID=2724896 RepID=UPI003BB20EBA
MISVAVGVIVSNKQVYLTYRNATQHQGDKWEFPGGKFELGETGKDALKRELFEEVGIIVKQAQPLTQITHDYGDKSVLLDVYIVDEFENEPKGKEGQHGKWLDIKKLDPLAFPKANIEIIKMLQSSSYSA